MDRSVLFCPLRQFHRISALGLLGFVSANPSPAPDPPRATVTAPAQPITYETSASSPSSLVPPMTPDISSPSKRVSLPAKYVSEQGSVGIVRNRGDRVTPNYSAEPASISSFSSIAANDPSFSSPANSSAAASRIASSARPHRSRRRDPLPRDVFCVEHGRCLLARISPPLKPSSTPACANSRRQPETADVWNAVRSGTTKSVEVGPQCARSGSCATRSGEALSYTIANEAPTESYDKLYNKSRGIGGSVDSFVEEVQRRFAKETSGLKNERVVGVVVAYGGEVAWSDIFASEDLFYKYWTKLLRSYARRSARAAELS